MTASLVILAKAVKEKINKNNVMNAFKKPPEKNFYILVSGTTQRKTATHKIQRYFARALVNARESFSRQ